MYHVFGADKSATHVPDLWVRSCHLTLPSISFFLWAFFSLLLSCEMFFASETKRPKAHFGMDKHYDVEMQKYQGSLQ